MSAEENKIAKETTDFSNLSGVKEVVDELRKQKAVGLAQDQKSKNLPEQQPDENKQNEGGAR